MDAFPVCLRVFDFLPEVADLPDELATTLCSSQVVVVFLTLHVKYQCLYNNSCAWAGTGTKLGIYVKSVKHSVNAI